MAYPPPPGFASLPARPPPSTGKPQNNGSFKPAFPAFAPRTIAGPTAAAQYSAAPAPNYTSAASYASASTPYAPASQPAYQAQPQYDQSYATNPTIKNPFIPVSASASTPTNPYGTFDPEYEAQLQQWQSAYAERPEKAAPGIAKTAAPRTDQTSTTSSTTTSNPASKTPQVTVARSGGGTTWTDSSLLEWDPAHFRIFVGNLAGEVTDDSLLKAFEKYPSVQKARVVRDKKTTKSKGFGFVSFSDGDDYFRAARDMEGKYIGSHPVKIQRAVTEVRPTAVKDRQHGKKGKYSGKGGGHDKVQHGGVEKKYPKTKGGLKVLG